MKRLVAAIILIFASIAVGRPASAQTSTPTPGPICGPGYYEQTASCVIYSANWSTTSSAVYSGGSLVSTTTIGANLQFRMYGTTLVIYRTLASTGTTANLCVDANCTTISFNNGTVVNMTSLSYEVDCLSVCNISITHNGTGGSGVNLDSFAIFWNDPTATPVTPLPTWTSQVITPLPTWTNQVVTALPTWTAQPPGYTPLPTWTAQGRSQYILTNGLSYEERDAGLNFVGAWTLDVNASYSSGAAYVTTSQSDYLTFTFYAQHAGITVRRSTSGDDLEACVGGGSCTTYDANSSNGFNSTINIASNIPGENTVIIRKANNNSNPLYIDRVAIQAWATQTPLPTWTSQVITPLATWTAQPGAFTPLPTWTAQPGPYTPLPTWTEQPIYTQIPYPTPLDTWTAQPGAFTPLPTWTPYLFPTPLDTWTAQPDIVVTFSGTVVAAIDWNGLLTVYPTLVSPIPPTLTPTETLTPSITPTPTPQGYMQIDLPNAEGTTVATGTLYMQATAGEVGNMILLFFMSLVGLVFIVRSIFEGRKSPI